MLSASAPGRSEADKLTLIEVQEATRFEIDRFRALASAEDVVKTFRRDLASPASRKIHGDLKRLRLPSLPDVEDEFERKVRAFGVDA